jgi:8-oxo-dGTP pyrophosphatase MutT (NUDIX family)
LYLMPIRVVAAVISRNGKVLLCQRPLHKRHGGLWELPGGKLEPTEDDEAGARRELLEELGLELETIEPAELEVADPDSPFLIAFVPVRTRGEPEAREHIALMWATPDELTALPLAPADRRYVEYRLMRATTQP